MNISFEELETEKLCLKKINDDDAKILYDEIFSCFEHYKYYHSRVYKNFEEFESNLKKNNERYMSRQYLKWAIYLKETNMLIGKICAHTKDYDNHSCQIGWIMGKSHLHQGYSFEAANKVIDFLFKNGFHRLEAVIVEDNLPSIKLAEKLNMKLEGIKEESYRINDKYLNQRVYTLINRK